MFDSSAKETCYIMIRDGGTSQIGLEVRTIIGDNLPFALVGVDVGINRHRAHAYSHAYFYYKIDSEVDAMSLENANAYAKHC